MTNDAAPGGTDNTEHDDDARRGVPQIPPGPLSGQQHSAGSQQRTGPVPAFAAPDPNAPPPDPRSWPSMPPAGPDSFASAPGQQGPFPTGPGQQGSYPTGPGQPGSYPVSGGQPGPYPMGPPPRRGGLPVWGWVLIGVGVVVVGFVGLIVTLFFLGLAASTTTSSGSDPLPAPTEIAIPDFTDDTGAGSAPDDPAAGTAIDVPELQPLDVSATFTTPPSWAQPLETWTMDDIPAEGISTFTSPNGCDLLLEQAYMPELEGGTDLASDAPATASYMVYLLEFFADLEGGTSEGQAGTVPLSINFAGGPTLDLASTTLPGLTLDGGTGVRFVATRAMPAGEGVVSAIITCPQAVVDADPGFFTQAMSQLYILPTP